MFVCLLYCIWKLSCGQPSFQRSTGLQTVDVEHGVHGPRTKVFFIKVF